MNVKCKWAFALAPFILMGCNDKFAQFERPGTASSGDEVQFAIAKGPATRTMYQDDWEEESAQQIYWGNYVEGEEEYINIYCPNTQRGFAKYKVTPGTTDKSVADTIVRMSDVGVQWGAKGPHTFYAFYPADKAGTTLTGGNTIRVTLDAGQSPVKYKYKTAEENADIGSFKEYIETQSQESQRYVPKCIYGMPDMKAAVMVARKTMSEEEFGSDVPLQFNVLADVLDLTINGPVTPNTLGGNGVPPAEYIQIQAVTIDVVDPVEGTAVEDYKIDNSISISGSFNLNMSEEVAGTKDMVSDVSGTSTIQIQTSMTEGGAIYYPTLFVRADLEEEGGASIMLDQFRLRAFLIPGQITGETLGKLRVHLQTNCGEFYQMLNNDKSFATGKLYPVTFGYFESRGADFDPSQWISQLNPDIYISELSIPGAWHAANTAYQGNHTLKEMYDAGVRAFEVHVKNGTDLRKAGDMETAFDLASATENFEKPFVKSSTTYDVKDVNIISTKDETSGDYKVNGNTYTRRRSIAATAASVEAISKITEYTVPKFWLRLYRTQDTNNTEPLSSAIESLHSIMNKNGIIFLEIGEEGRSGLTVNYKSSSSYTKTATKNNVAVAGYQYSENGTWQDVYTWESVDMSGANETETDRTTSGAGTDLSLDAREAWAIAVRSCLENLANKDIVYEGDLDRNTTIRDVQGKIVVKINTNDDASEASYLWGDNTPALFSRWIDGSANTPLTINLKWKSPAAPYMPGTIDEVDSNSDALRWCFTELDNIANGSSIDKRQKAIIAMNETAAKNYAGGLHRTFYESMIGGYENGSLSTVNCQTVAKSMNTFALGRITNPTRQAVPLGLVFMNYVIAPDGNESEYNSSALIRAIINNNKAFLLNRAGGSNAPDVEENVNSHFTNNSQNPLK